MRRQSRRLRSLPLQFKKKKIVFLQTQGAYIVIIRRGTVHVWLLVRPNGYKSFFGVVACGCWHTKVVITKRPLGYIPQNKNCCNDIPSLFYIIVIIIMLRCYNPGRPPHSFPLMSLAYWVKLDWGGFCWRSLRIVDRTKLSRLLAGSSLVRGLWAPSSLFIQNRLRIEMRMVNKYIYVINHNKKRLGAIRKKKNQTNKHETKASLAC